MAGAGDARTPPNSRRLRTAVSLVWVVVTLVVTLVAALAVMVVAALVVMVVAAAGVAIISNPPKRPSGTRLKISNASE